MGKSGCWCSFSVIVLPEANRIVSCQIGPGIASKVSLKLVHHPVYGDNVMNMRSGPPNSWLGARESTCCSVGMTPSVNFLKMLTTKGPLA